MGIQALFTDQDTPGEFPVGGGGGITSSGCEVGDLACEEATNADDAAASRAMMIMGGW